jgi:hypothetical protein
MKSSLALLLVAFQMSVLTSARAAAESIYAAEVIAAVGDGDNEVVELSGRYPTYEQSQPDGGVHALGPPDYWTVAEGSGTSGWLTWSGSMILHFDYFLQDGAGNDLTVHHWGYGSIDISTSDTVVLVSSDGATWIELGSLSRWDPLISYNTGTTFDFADYGVDNVNYVRIDKYGACERPGDCNLFVDAVEGHYPGGTDRPVVTLASGDTTQAPLTPGFQAEHWDPDSGYIHTRSQWQISTASDFSSLVMDQISKTDLTTFTVPGFLLDTDTLYYCRARFYDHEEIPSPWSVRFSFTTVAVTGEDTTVYASRALAAVGGIDQNGMDRPVVKDQNGVWPTYEADGGAHALGAPDYGQGGFASGWSNWGGYMILGFDVPVTDLVGVDLVVYHWGPGARDSDRSTSFAYASENGNDDWVLLGELSQSDRGVVTTDSYDFEDFDGLDTVNYVKVVKNYNETDRKKCGKYIDAVKGNPTLMLGQEVDDNGSLVGHWTDEDVSAGRMKFVNPVVSGEVDTDAQIGVWIDQKENPAGTTVMAISSVDPLSIPDTAGRPDEMSMGLVRFKVAVPDPGDDALVTIYLPAPVAEGAKWYKYDTTRGWQDCTALGYATFVDSRTVTVQLKDGAYGDADLTENGIIVDPGGPGVAVSGTVVLEGSDADTRAAGGCFIGAAASGSAAVDTGHGKAMGLF